MCYDTAISIASSSESPLQKEATGLPHLGVFVLSIIAICEPPKFGQLFIALLLLLESFLLFFRRLLVQALLLLCIHGLIHVDV